MPPPTSLPLRFRVTPLRYYARRHWRAEAPPEIDFLLLIGDSID
jgi:hypothetical protein